jgi:hypothetical protein
VAAAQARVQGLELQLEEVRAGHALELDRVRPPGCSPASRALLPVPCAPHPAPHLTCPPTSCPLLHPCTPPRPPPPPPHTHTPPPPSQVRMDAEADAAASIMEAQASAADRARAQVAQLQAQLAQLRASFTQQLEDSQAQLAAAREAAGRAGGGGVAHAGVQTEGGGGGGGAGVPGGDDGAGGGEGSAYATPSSSLDQAAAGVALMHGAGDGGGGGVEGQRIGDERAAQQQQQPSPGGPSAWQGLEADDEMCRWVACWRVCGAAITLVCYASDGPSSQHAAGPVTPPPRVCLCPPPQSVLCQRNAQLPALCQRPARQPAAPAGRHAAAATLRGPQVRRRGRQPQPCGAAGPALHAAGARACNHCQQRRRAGA